MCKVVFFSRKATLMLEDIFVYLVSEWLFNLARIVTIISQMALIHAFLLLKYWALQGFHVVAKDLKQRRNLLLPITTGGSLSPEAFTRKTPTPGQQPSPTDHELPNTSDPHRADPPEEPCRTIRSGRITRPPAYLQDYET